MPKRIHRQMWYVYSISSANGVNFFRLLREAITVQKVTCVDQSGHYTLN